MILILIDTSSHIRHLGSKTDIFNNKYEEIFYRESFQK